MNKKNYSPIEPLVVDSPSSVKWSREADMVVVGFGAGGVSAALEGVGHGEVIAIDRFAGGGAAAHSGGLVVVVN